MTPKDFVFWLRGLLSCYSGKNKLILLIMDKLKLVDEYSEPFQFPKDNTGMPFPQQPTIVMYGCGQAEWKPMPNTIVTSYTREMTEDELKEFNKIT
jgi:hypothetical protein